jgi:hypothetical protein
MIHHRENKGLGYLQHDQIDSVLSSHLESKKFYVTSVLPLKEMSPNPNLPTILFHVMTPETPDSRTLALKKLQARLDAAPGELNDISERLYLLRAREFGATARRPNVSLISQIEETLDRVNTAWDLVNSIKEDRTLADTDEIRLGLLWRQVVGEVSMRRGEMRALLGFAEG